MSASTIIKNIILITLIILIGHFMLQNILLGNPTKVSSKPVPETKPLEVKDIAIPTTTKQASIDPTINQTIGNPSSKSVEVVNGGLDKAKEELLKFVDDEDEGFNTYFQPTLKLEAVPSDNCKLKTQDTSLPLSTSCDPLILDLKKEPTKEHNDDKKGLMILKQYENENSMNGGLLYGGLNAYDTYTDNFEHLS